MRKALYREYRPEIFSEVVGQEAPIKVLQNALKDDSLSHAYMFSGPRGTGKTSIAKIFAKAANCIESKNGEPCGKCHNCNQVNSADIIEIDAASNNGVDEIREIRENVKYAPTNGRFKVYIIDEVHMLTIAAFNALLKTLEEPPKHVIFILATTEPHKVPLTIISRCQRYEFKRISIKDIIGRMKKVLNQENVQAEESALELIARVAQGGMRDALSLLDQAISHSEGKVTLDDVIAITGTVGLDLLTKTISFIHEKRISEVLDVVNEIVEGGKEPHFFLEDLLTYYRDLVMYKTLGEKAELSKAMLDDTFITLSQKVATSTIYAITDALNEKLKDIRYSNNSKVLLELALVKVCQPSLAVDPMVIDEIISLVRREFGNGITPQQTKAAKEVAVTKIIEKKEEEDSVLRADNELNSSVTPEDKNELFLPEKQEDDNELILSETPEDDDIFGVLNEVESQITKIEKVELPNETEETTSTFKEEQSENTDSLFDDTFEHPGDNDVPASDDSFFEMIQRDIEAGADYIEVIDGEPTFNNEPVFNDEPLSNEAPSFTEEPAKNEEVEAKEIISEEAAEINSILNSSSKQYKNEFLSKEQEFLVALKKKKLPVFKLFSSSEKVWAVSETHMVVEYNPKFKLACGNINKPSNQKTLKEVFSSVFGRELEVKAYTSDVLIPIIDQYRK